MGMGLGTKVTAAVAASSRDWPKETDTRTECRLLAFEVACFVAVLDSFFFGPKEVSDCKRARQMRWASPFSAGRRLRCVLIALKCL